MFIWPFLFVIGIFWVVGAPLSLQNRKYFSSKFWQEQPHEAWLVPAPPFSTEPRDVGDLLAGLECVSPDAINEVEVLVGI
ncbi:hypothetical protein EV424DRAFT_1453909 [Suillus variegatus]|nr:hypothetical protein EV424DRAFT_1453909 [Suillus variegatus]